MSSVCRRTLMPASRAASGLPPIATVRRPKVVRLSRTQASAATTRKMMTSSGMPSTLVYRELVDACVTVTIWVSLPEIFCGQPAGRDHGGERGDERDQPAVRDQDCR